MSNKINTKAKIQKKNILQVNNTFFNVNTAKYPPT